MRGQVTWPNVWSPDPAGVGPALLPESATLTWQLRLHGLQGAGVPLGGDLHNGRGCGFGPDYCWSGEMGDVLLRRRVTASFTTSEELACKIGSVYSLEKS